MQIQSIKVLGSGCQNCKRLFEITKKVVEDLHIHTEVEYITDMEKIIALGVLTTPVLAINDAPVLTGKGHSEDEIKSIFFKINNQE